jgi:hypothetical protein
MADRLRINARMLALVLVVLAQTSDSLDAWQKVYSVMVSPRCINCHTATSYPQQGATIGIATSRM